MIEKPSVSRDSGTSGCRRPLTLHDRVCIQNGLTRGLSVTQIAAALGRSAQTIAGEIRRNVTTSTTHFRTVKRGNICSKAGLCSMVGLCSNDCGDKECRRCDDGRCNTVCAEFSAVPCARLDKSPFCCNGCVHLTTGRGCASQHKVYDAAIAHEAARLRRSESRRGIDASQELHEQRNRIISDGVSRGQSPAHILSSNPCLNMSLQTLYNHLNRGVYDAKRMHLKAAVRRKPRKSGKDPYEGNAIPRECLRGRTYDDWRRLPDSEKLRTVQMDTVIGRKTDTQCILSLQWKEFALQVYMLLEKKGSAEVVEAFDMLQEAVGLEEFRRMIPILLTDRGSEFSNVDRIERDSMGNERCRVYFCDPYHSQQKPNAERAHVELRWILPKKKSNFDALTRRDMALLSSHLNSLSKRQLAGATPLSLAQGPLSPILEALGIEEVPANEVVENPLLLPHAMLPGTGLSGRKGLDD